MAGKDWNTPHALALARALEREPYRFDFFRALRLLECAFSAKPRIGESLRPADDPVRLAQESSLAFAPSTVASFQRSPGGRSPRLSVFFFGLFGPQGALPLHLTEYSRTRSRGFHDATFGRFVDLFHHRMLSLFYRAWASAQPTVQHDRPPSDRFATYVGSLLGIGMPALRGRELLADSVKLHYAARFACQARPPEGLRATLADFFRVPVAVEEFIGVWLDVPPDDRLRLEIPPGSGPAGRPAALGSRVWDRQQKFRIRLGPVGVSRYQSFLPGSESLRSLVALVRGYVGFELRWDLCLVLRKEEVPPLKLDGTGRLGWTTWVTSRPPARDAGDLLIDPEARAA